MISTVSNAELFKQSDDKGLFAISGGRLNNELNAQSILNFNSGNIATTDVNGDANFKMTNVAKTPSKMIVDDHIGGFTAKGGATLYNTINQESHINVNNGSTVKAKGNLNIAMNTGADGFEQSVTSKAGGGFAYNKASSAVTANIKNYINVNSGLLQGKQVNINIDSSNKLGAEAYVHTSHIFGQPKVDSEVNLNVDNNVTIGDGTGDLGDAKISATSESPDGVAVNINYMGNSKQVINQVADIWVQAAVASADYGGAINFNTNNNLNVNTDGYVASSKDVNVLFKRGEEDMSSYVHYKKISRLLFGIKITKEGSWSAVKTASKNNAVIDGKIEAGAGNSMKMNIDKDGNVASGTTITSDLYNKETSTTSVMTAEEIAAEQKDIKTQITELSTELDALNKSQETNKTKATALQTQLDSLNDQLALVNYTNGLASDKKIDLATFKSSLYDSILSTMKGLKYETTDTNGNKVVYTITDDATLKAFANNLVYDTNSSNGADNSNFIAYFLGKLDSTSGNIAEGVSISEANKSGDVGNVATVSDLTSYVNGLNATMAVFNKTGVDSNNNPVYSATASSTAATTVSAASLTTNATNALASIKTNDIKTSQVTSGGKTFDVTTYNGKTLVAGTTTDDISAAITSTTSAQADLASAMTETTNNMSAISQKIVNAQNLYDNLATPSATTTYKNGSYTFAGLNATGGAINIKSITVVLQMFQAQEVLL
jgi:hypothetical protein